MLTLCSQGRIPKIRSKKDWTQHLVPFAKDSKNPFVKVSDPELGAPTSHIKGDPTLLGWEGGVRTLTVGQVIF